MAQPAQKKIKASTQDFTEISDISEDVVILKGGSACLIIEVQSVNFALLSREEQNAKIYSYASLLNSLSFQIQIVIRNKKVDITSYLQLVEQEAKKVQSPQLAQYIELYKTFVQDLVKINTVLDKKFYIVVPYSSLEKGIQAVAGVSQKGLSQKETFILQARQVLHTKAETLHAQLARLNLRAKTLQKDELIRLFYDEFNRDFGQSQLSTDISSTVVRGQ